METQPTREQIRQARRYACEFIKLLAKNGAGNKGVDAVLVDALVSAAEITGKHGLEKTMNAFVSTYLTVAISLKMNMLGDTPDPAETLDRAAAQLRETLAALAAGRALPAGVVDMRIFPHEGGAA